MSFRRIEAAFLRMREIDNQERLSTDLLLQTQKTEAFPLAAMTHFILQNDYPHFLQLSNALPLDFALYPPLILAFAEVLSFILGQLEYGSISKYFQNKNENRPIGTSRGTFIPKGTFRACESINELLFKQLDIILAHLGPRVGLCVPIYIRLTKMLTKILRHPSSYTITMPSVGQKIYKIVKEVLFPALSYVNKNCGASA